MKGRILSAVLAAFLQALSFATLAQGKACALVTPAEVEAALGIKPVFNGKTLPSGVDVCNSTAGTWVLIRLFKRDKPAMSEQEEIDMMKKAGATVEARKFGAITCMAVVPGGAYAQQMQKFSTTCKIAKPPMFAVIEVMSPTERTPIDRLHPLAEKMLTRF